MNPVIVGTEEQIEKLRDACEWMGIERGRATLYHRLLEQSLRGGDCSNEHLLAPYESSEIVDLYVLWKPHAAEFPGVKEKLRRVAAKGATLREGEKPSSSGNKPRNDAFVLLLAGKLLAVDVDVVGVDGAMRSGVTGQERADIVVSVKSELFLVECKRLQSWKQLEKRVREAYRQIRKCSHAGIVAVDCSVLLRPSSTILETHDLVLAEARVSSLEHQVTPELYRYLGARGESGSSHRDRQDAELVPGAAGPDLLGMVLFARIPAMTLVKAPGDHYRRDCVSSWLVVGNRYAEESNLVAMNEIGRKLTNQAPQSGVSCL